MADQPKASVQTQAQNFATGTDTVTVACNLPNGYVLQMYNIEEVVSFLPNGREIRENNCTLNLEHGQWALHGPVNFNSLAATGREVNVDFRVIKGDAPDCGYALTPGIPRDFWEAWLEVNTKARNPVVTNRNVFAAATETRAVGQAKEFREFKSGLQGLNQRGDYRVPNGKMIRKFDKTDNRTVPEEEE
jgi:hypothetical protein